MMSEISKSQTLLCVGAWPSTVEAGTSDAERLVNDKSAASRIASALVPAADVNDKVLCPATG